MNKFCEREEIEEKMLKVFPPLKNLTVPMRVSSVARLPNLTIDESLCFCLRQRGKKFRISRVDIVENVGCRKKSCKFNVLSLLEYFDSRNTKEKLQSFCDKYPKEMEVRMKYPISCDVFSLVL